VSGPALVAMARAGDLRSKRPPSSDAGGVRADAARPARTRSRVRRACECLARVNPARSTNALLLRRQSAVGTQPPRLQLRCLKIYSMCSRVIAGRSARSHVQQRFVSLDARTAMIFPSWPCHAPTSARGKGCILWAAVPDQEWSPGLSRASKLLREIPSLLHCAQRRASDRTSA
jgi:hypothetical protein